MKLLVVNSNLMGKDGMTMVINNLFARMDKDGICADVAAINPPPEALCEQFRNHGGKIFVIQNRLTKPLQYIRRLRRIIKENKYDLVHIHGSSAIMALELLAAWRGGCKVRLAHSHNTTCKFKLLHFALKPVFQMLCTHRLACGEEAGKWLYGNKDFLVIRNGIDTQKFAFSQLKRESIRRNLQIPHGRKIIGHVGVFNLAKNQRFLVDILKCLTDQQKDYGLILIGEGRCRQSVEAQVQQLGLTDRVIFIGNTDCVPDYLDACDLLSMPSLYEGIPLTLVEAQANGLQCVVSDAITKETDMTGNLHFLELASSEDYWAQVIDELDICVDRMVASETAICGIKERGYDIHTEAARLKEYYSRVL